MQFIGREEQLSKIEKAISDDQMHVSLIYGRRRVGKSELVKQALQRTDVKSIYYECKQVTEASNTQSISDIVSAEFGLPRLAYTQIEELTVEIVNELIDKIIIHKPVGKTRGRIMNITIQYNFIGELTNISE